MKPNPVDVQSESKTGHGSGRVLSLEEIAKHNQKVRGSNRSRIAGLSSVWFQNDAWIIIDNNVYDVTSILSIHPGM
jgi:hypothetical protein